mgnify:CR=1 FL=1
MEDAMATETQVEMAMVLMEMATDAKEVLAEMETTLCWKIWTQPMDLLAVRVEVRRALAATEMAQAALEAALAQPK